MIHLENFKLFNTTVHGKVQINKLYLHTCDNCGADKCYAAKSYNTPFCNKCSKRDVEKSDATKVKMSIAAGGSKIKTNHLETRQIQGRTRFADCCTKCNKDKGFVRKNDIGKPCKSCSNSINKTGKPSSKKGIPSRIIPWNKGKSYSKISAIQKRIKHSVKSNITVRLKKRNSSKNFRKTIDILGYSISDLILHLESKFTIGMNWENYGEWHIDHVTPDSWFNYSSTNDEDFKKSWALNNLQPLWAADNIRKSNKYAGIPKKLGG